MSQNDESRDVQMGIFLLMLAHAIAIVVASVLSYILGHILFRLDAPPTSAVYSFSGVAGHCFNLGLWLFAGIGVSQWLYVIPLILIRLRRRGGRKWDCSREC